MVAETVALAAGEAAEWRENCRLVETALPARAVASSKREIFQAASSITVS